MTQAQSDEALDVLRAVWQGQGQGQADIDEACGTANGSCRVVQSIGFEGLAEETGDVKSAWRETLEREGKLNKGPGSIRDLVLGPQKAN